MMLGKGEMGTPVIDELRVCYIADPSLLADLAKIEIGKSWEFAPFTLFRQGSDTYDFLFAICIGDLGNRQQIGLLKFGRYGAKDAPYTYYKVSNQALYSPDIFRLALSLPEMLGMVFNNLTAIDIAIDYRKNTSAIIKRMMRNEEVTTILNGRALKDRAKIIPGITVDYSTSLKRLHCPTITMRQAKAIHNKEKGITVQSYDKKAEVEASSGKEYILDYYGRPRFLFRLEVRLHYQELKDFCSKIGMVQSIEMVFDPAFLDAAFYYHLATVLRFTKGRRKLDWRDIIACTGRV
ncbi:MAG: hypothetical protein IKO88_04815 [Bacteroidales bacterium]|nr:hypothetical protein [Bacteroidales bacterium]